MHGTELLFAPCDSSRCALWCCAVPLLSHRGCSCHRHKAVLLCRAPFPRSSRARMAGSDCCAECLRWRLCRRCFSVSCLSCVEWLQMFKWSDCGDGVQRLELVLPGSNLNCDDVRSMHDDLHTHLPPRSWCIASRSQGERQPDISPAPVETLMRVMLTPTPGLHPAWRAVRCRMRPQTEPRAAPARRAFRPAFGSTCHSRRRRLP